MARRGRPTSEDTPAATSEGFALSNAPPDNGEDQ